MTIIPLDRIFSLWRDGTDADTDFRRYLERDGLDWEALQVFRRVVILAEAGSGKTTEMKERARLLKDAGKFGFYATVEDVGTNGLDGALRAADRPRLDAWRAASDDEAWFFIDSVDEAKGNRVRLEKVVGRLADAIAGCERRAHVILSCRLMDWETRADLARFSDGLPVPTDTVAPPPPSPEDLVRAVVRNEEIARPEVVREEPISVVMRVLDAERIRKFAAGKNVFDLDAFLGAIETANLWRFARRPLDLDWLVDFWIDNKRLGSLTEMLEHSLSARVREPNPDRQRGDSLDETRALQALERIGAALDFGRKTRIAVPDSEVLLAGEERPIDIADVLPDWTPADRGALLTRPVFDPASFGRVILHNDNQGVVRSFLAAKWLHRLRQTNLSQGELFDLLFATSYGVEVIKPSMQQTAAWLAIWDPDVGQEIVRREPVLLLTAGDPASLSVEVRAAALRNIVRHMVEGKQRFLHLDHDIVKRFARPDICPAIRAIWSKHESDEEVRQLLLRLIWIGELRDCADLALAAFNSHADRYTRLFGARATTVAGDGEAKRWLSDHVQANCAGLENALIWDAVDGLFPQYLAAVPLLKILTAINVADADGGLGFDWLAPRLVERLNSAHDLEQFLHGLLVQLGPAPPTIGHIPDKREQVYFVAIAAAAARLLEICDPNEAPVDAIDTALELLTRGRYGPSVREVKDVVPLLHLSPARRRAAFWRAAERLNRHLYLQGRDIERVWEMQAIGYQPNLQAEDLSWLLADAPQRAVEHERLLAIDGAMQLWDAAGRPPDMLRQIKAVADRAPNTKVAVDQILNPPPPPPGLVAQQRQIEKMQLKGEREREKRDRSWIAFVDRLKADPDQLRQLPPATPDLLDGRLYHLWQLLSQTERSGTSTYSISTMAPVEPMLGKPVAAALRDALVKHWHSWVPQRKSLKSRDELNRILISDCMGIAGIGLEASADPRWAEKLTPDEATRAAVLATLELNGFPPWIGQLAAAQPSEVRNLLMGEIRAELADPIPRDRYGILEDVARADDTTINLLADDLLGELRGSAAIPLAALKPMVATIVRAVRNRPAEFVALALDRFKTGTDVAVAGLYFQAAFALDSTLATEALMTRLDALTPADQKILGTQVLPGMFGGPFNFSDLPLGDVKFADLKRLVLIAFRTVRVDDDNVRPSGQVYSPDLRDNAEQARGIAFQRLTETPGRATFDTLFSLESEPDFPVPRARLVELALSRAVQDSESASWSPAQVVGFERTSKTQPSTPKDLQQVALRRLTDIQHDLLHHDFAQGATFKGLPDETAVQIWAAHQLSTVSGPSYTVERESHVVDEKAPDVRLRSKVGDARLPIEIKVAEDWTLKKLEAALNDQLCGRYLRAQDARHGILLLVHKNARPQGWEDTAAGVFLTFEQVVDRLRRTAAEIAGRDPGAPQPEIAVLDVTSCGERGKTRPVQGNVVRADS